jgi:predicted acylesterase/phospholipase RssA
VRQLSRQVRSSSPHPFLNDKINRLGFISPVSVTSSPPDLHNSTFKLLFAHSCQFAYTIHDAICYSCSLPGESLPRLSSTSEVVAGNSADPHR